MKWHGKLYIGVLLVILYLPVFFSMFYSFNSAGNMVYFEHSTPEHHQALLQDDHLISVIFNTIAVALLSVVVFTIIGAFGAISIYYLRNKKFKLALLILNSALMISSDVAVGASSLIMFIVLGHIFGLGLGFGTVSASHIVLCIPIVVIPALPQLYKMNRNTLNVARDPGATESQVLGRILLPNLMSAIIGGFFMAPIYSLDDLTVSFFVAGNGFSVLLVEVYVMARKGISMEINAISTILLLVIALGIIGYYALRNILERRGAKRGAIE